MENDKVTAIVRDHLQLARIVDTKVFRPVIIAPGKYNLVEAPNPRVGNEDWLVLQDEPTVGATVTYWADRVTLNYV